jgi:hypothetical protein
VKQRERCRERSRTLPQQRSCGPWSCGRPTTPIVDAWDAQSRVVRALAANLAVDARYVDVQSDAATRIIVLRGFIESVAQMRAAGDIAGLHAREYAIQNLLIARRR